MRFQLTIIGSFSYFTYSFRTNAYAVACAAAKALATCGQRRRNVCRCASSPAAQLLPRQKK